MFETYESLPEPTVRKFPLDNWSRKPKREIETYWSLGQATTERTVGVEPGEVRLSLTVSHDPDSKVFRSTLTWDTLHPTEPGGSFTMSTWASDHRMVSLGREPVARYSQKALEEEYQRVLGVFEIMFETVVSQVIEQALAMSGVEEPEQGDGPGDPGYLTSRDGSAEAYFAAAGVEGRVL